MSALLWINKFYGNFQEAAVIFLKSSPKEMGKPHSQYLGKQFHWKNNATIKKKKGGGGS